AEEEIPEQIDGVGKVQSVVAVDLRGGGTRKGAAAKEEAEDGHRVAHIHAAIEIPVAARGGFHCAVRIVREEARLPGKVLRRDHELARAVPIQVAYREDRALRRELRGDLVAGDEGGPGLSRGSEEHACHASSLGAGEHGDVEEAVGVYVRDLEKTRVPAHRKGERRHVRNARGSRDVAAEVAEDATSRRREEIVAPVSVDVGGAESMPGQVLAV